MKKSSTRRKFIKTAGAGAAILATGCSKTQNESLQDYGPQGKINKREAVLSLLDEQKKQDYIPAAFFIHFDKKYQIAPAAIDKHLAYFRYTNMDFFKIQYELPFPVRPEIKSPKDWVKMPIYRKDFFEKQLKVVEGIIKAGKKEALVLQTLYSPFMCAGQSVRHPQTDGGQVITEHIKEDPDKVKKGMEIVTESVMVFVKECIKLGVDGFYASSQGGESERFKGTSLFEDYVKPYDLIIWEEISKQCQFNILHICDFEGGYEDLTPFLDYPSHVVNSSLELGSKILTPKKVSGMFKKPYMGGLDKRGIIVSGNQSEIKKAVKDLLNQASDKFILGAECTLPHDVNWENMKTAISTAHEYKRT